MVDPHCWRPVERTIACPTAISVSSPATDNTSQHVERRTVQSPAMSLESRRPLSDLFASGPLHDARGGAPVASVPASSLRDGSGVCHRSVLNSADYCWISRRYHSSCMSSQQTVAASSDSAWRSSPLERTDGPSQSHLSSNPIIFGRCRNECRLPEVLYSFRLCTIL